MALTVSTDEKTACSLVLDAASAGAEWDCRRGSPSSSGGERDEEMFEDPVGSGNVAERFKVSIWLSSRETETEIIGNTSTYSVMNRISGLCLRTHIFIELQKISTFQNT